MQRIFSFSSIPLSVKVLAVAGVAVATLGSTGPQTTQASDFVAKARTLSPQPQQVAANTVAPIVDTQVVTEEATSTPVAETVAPVQKVATTARKAVYGGGGSDLLARIRACESGGNYAAVNPSGKYRGAYQFDYRTWQSVGGSGDPAAASPAEQDMRAQALMSQRGSNPWPVCGRR